MPLRPIDTKPFLKVRWENESNRRYYEAWVDEDLFGWVLTRIWGKKGTSLGQVVHQPCCDFQSGVNEINLIDKRRKQHGYNAVSVVSQ